MRLIIVLLLITVVQVLIQTIRILKFFLILHNLEVIKILVGRFLEHVLFFILGYQFFCQLAVLFIEIQIFFKFSNALVYFGKLRGVFSFLFVLYPVEDCAIGGKYCFTLLLGHFVA